MKRLLVGYLAGLLTIAVAQNLWFLLSFRRRVLPRRRRSGQWLARSE